MAVLTVLTFHAGAALLLGHWAAEPPAYTPSPVVMVDLISPPPAEPSPPSPPERPSASEGGGAPASTSAVRVLRERRDAPPPEVTAPPIITPDPPLVMGVAEKATPTPGMEQGGEGTGIGRGQGSGSGDGVGSGPRFLRGPTQGELRALHPRDAFRRRQGGRVSLSCKLRGDGRLEQCRVLTESPGGQGFGTAALAAAQYFRFRPGTRDGRPIDGAEIQVGVEWP